MKSKHGIGSALVILILINFSSIHASAAGGAKVDVIVGFAAKPDIDLVRGRGGEVHRVYKLIPAMHVSLPEEALEALSRNPKIAYIHENVRVKAHEQFLPWGIEHINADQVWGETAGSGVKIAVLDTGVGPHLDLLVSGGIDIVNGDSDPSDDDGHGTHVAGTIAALNNELGVVGAAPEAEIYAVKVLDNYGEGYVSWIIEGIEWSVDNGMDIVSMSLGTPTDLQALHDAVDAAYGAGLLVVASAGNSGNPGGGGDNVEYPADYESVMAVAATDSNNIRGDFSSTGPAVEISAPGVDIVSTYLDDSYAIGDGTSMACPHVSGAAALVWAKNPTLTNAEVRQILQDTATDLGAAGRDNLYGYGLVNAYEAVEATPNLPPSVCNLNPVDGATDVPISITSLSFSISDPEGYPMDYTVTTTPDIGSDTVPGVWNGWHSVGVQGLDYSTTYTWTISVDDGISTPTVEIISFTTQSMEATQATVEMTSLDPDLTTPSESYRWLDVADQQYSSDYRESYTYLQGTVDVTHSIVDNKLRGTITGSNLKPNFAYQVKLVGTPGTPSNELVGYAGRWWQEEWDGTQWTGGQNLNDKGDGSSPNPNDLSYESRKTLVDATSPTGHKYKYTGYLVLDYFTTDENGEVSLMFETGSSHHVLWKVTQRTPTSDDGEVKTAVFDPDPGDLAYDSDYPSNAVSIFGEWERLPMGKVPLDTGTYYCQLILTEESFHGSGGTYAGNWAGAMGANIVFQINEEAHTPKITNPTPFNGAIDVSVSTSILGFSISDPDGDPMDYTVTTSPDIDSGSGNAVSDGTYSITVSGLDYSTTYTWEITVDDGIENPTIETCTFTTEDNLNIDPSVVYLRSWGYPGGRLDPAGSIARGGKVRVFSQVSDPETASSALTVYLSYRPAGGEWVRMPASYYAASNYWYVDWVIPMSVEPGVYDTRVEVADPDGGSVERVEAGEFTVTSLPNADPTVVYLRAWGYPGGRLDPAGSIARGGKVRVYSQVKDLETASSALTVYLSYRTGGGDWVRMPASYYAASNYWYIDWVIPMDAVPGLYDTRVEVADPDGGSVERIETGEFTVTAPNTNPSVVYLRAWGYPGGRLDLTSGEIARGNKVRIFSQVKDAETASSALTVYLSYRTGGGEWVRQQASYYAPSNYWYIDWTIPMDAVAGLYDTRVEVSDPDGGSAERIEAGEFTVN